MLFEIKDIDKKCYENELRDFLPARIIDIHTHVWLAEHKSPGCNARRTATWPDRVAKDNSVEDLLETYKLMFPGKQVTPMIFTNSISVNDNLDAQNEYINQSAKKHNLPALLWSLPSWSKDELNEKLSAGKFLGVKSYLANVPDYIPGNEIRIFDIFPHHQLELLNSQARIMMLHIPRSGRLKDPVNLAQMLELDKRYPNIKTIIAHVGRAYCTEDIGNAFEVLSKTKNLLFDFCANTNAEVFRELIDAVGAKRILFGSDLPILRMRMKRICENGKYVNLVPKGLYGDVSADPNMREVSDDESKNFTFFMYEELLAFKKAAQSAKLSSDEIADIFHNNAKRIMTPYKQQLQMIWPEDKLNQPPEYTLPDGYTMRTYQHGDEDGMIRLMAKAGFDSWNEQALATLFTRALPNGTFFIVHDATGDIVATASASYNAKEPNPFAGMLDWVASDPEHRGKKLGYAVSAAVVEKLIKDGYKKITLATDDFRIPAIKTYLKMGFLPHHVAEDHERRWTEVQAKLK